MSSPKYHSPSTRSRTSLNNSTTTPTASTNPTSTITSTTTSTSVNDNNTTNDNDTAINTRLTTLKLTWDGMLDQLKSYQEEHGNINIHPTEFTHNPKLGRWVQVQRLAYRQYQMGRDNLLMRGMCPERVELLEGIGFEWNIDYEKYEKSDHDSKATKITEEQKERQEQQQLKEKEEEEEEEPQIQQKKSKKEKRKHNEINESYNDEDDNNNDNDEDDNEDDNDNEDDYTNEDHLKQSIEWEHKFKKLVKFKKIHKHCDVPRRYTIDPKLGKWVDYQRTGYKRFKLGQSKGKNGMNKTRIKRLEDIGFHWSFRDGGRKPMPLNHSYMSPSNKRRSKHDHDHVEGNDGDYNDDKTVHSTPASSSSRRKKRKSIEYNNDDDDIKSIATASTTSKKVKKKKPTFSTSLKDIIDSKLTSTKTSGIKKLSPTKAAPSTTSPKKSKTDTKDQISRHDDDDDGSPSIAEIILRKYGFFKEGRKIDYTTFKSLAHYYYLKNNGWLRE